jgi:hypothetical protein
VLEAGALETGNDRGQRNHLTVLHWIEKRCIKALMRALVESLVVPPMDEIEILRDLAWRGDMHMTVTRSNIVPHAL